MKKSIWIGLILFSLVLSSQAQDKKTIFGISLNPGLSWASADNSHYSSEGTSFSFAYGVDVDFYFAKNYAFSTGLQIQNHKTQINYPTLIPSVGDPALLESAMAISKFSYQAFHVPAFLKLKTNPIGYNSYFAEFGASMFFPFKANEEGEIQRSSGEKVNMDKVGVLSNTSFMSVNLLLGLGMEIPFSGDTKFQIGIRYLNGITSLSSAKAYKTDESGMITQEEINNGSPSGSDENYFSNILSLNLRVVF